MTPQPSTTGSAPPQTGRSAADHRNEESPQGLWAQLLARFRDLSGAFDPFANDAEPSVRALGRQVRQRRPAEADDYFALGDLCARLTLQENSLSETYAAKTIAAYMRAGDIAPGEIRAARAALIQFTYWVIDAAIRIGRYDSLKVGLLVVERVRQLGVFPPASGDGIRLQRAEAELRERLAGIFEDDVSPAESHHVLAERESRMLCDQGQMLLRQNQASEALACFERALQADRGNHAAWLWRAMALTDLGRFNDALVSYDRALSIEPGSAGVWNSKGSLLLELGRLAPALECFDNAIDLSTSVATVKAVYWLNKGKSLYMLGRYQEALAALSESHTLDPSPESAAGIAACKERIESPLADPPAA